MKWNNPLKNMKCVGISNDSFSYAHINIEKKYEILIHPHCGSFGVKRKHDIHKGVDLYAPIGTDVYPVEPGTIVDMSVHW